MSDSFQFKCPFCEQEMEVPKELQGEIAHCPSCNKEIVPIKKITPKARSIRKILTPEAKRVKGQGVLVGILAGVLGGIGCLMPLGFLICSIGLLIIGVPFIFVGLLLPIILPFIMGSQALQGKCPWCETQVTCYIASLGIKCPACKKRIVIRDKQFIKID